MSDTGFSNLNVGQLLVMEDGLWKIVHRTFSRFYIERADRPTGQETPRWIHRHRPSKRILEICSRAC